MKVGGISLGRWRAAGVFAALALVIGLARVESVTRPAVLNLPRAAAHVGSEAQLLDRHGELLQSLRIEHRHRRIDWVPLQEMSPALLLQVLKAEDQRFYSHSGVDWLAVLHAAWQNGQPKSSGIRGASTISMQLAGHLLGQQPDATVAWARRTWPQKIRQARAAWQLEAQASKRDILEAYLNTVSLRGELQGVAAAAQGLFGKRPIGLDRRESAVLVSLLSAPQASAQRVARRACRLLGPDCDPLLLPTTRLNRPYPITSSDQLAPHLAVKLLHGAAPGSRLHSTLDLRVQRMAINLLAEHLRELQSQRVEDGAVVVLDNLSGEVLAYVGSSGALSDAEHVDAASAPRQAGSTLKPFLYAMAIEQRRLTAASLLDDSALAISTADAQYLPRNYGNDFKGWVSVRKALAGSLNVPAVRTLALLDPDAFAQRLRDLGLSSVKQDGGYYGYSLALGSAEVKLIELANAYRTLANQGAYSPVRFVLPRATNPPPVFRTVVPADSVQIVSDILADNEARAVTFGLDSALRLPFRASVKTGTSKDMRDNWALGYSRDFTVAVWVGNASGAPMKGVSGVSGAAPVWRAMMLGLHSLRGQGQADPVLLSSVIRVPVQFKGVHEPQRSELFLRGTEMREVLLSTGSGAMPAAITQPLNGAIYSMDPDIPLSHQTLTFQQTDQSESGRPAGRHWLLNSRKLGGAARISWPLSPGKHRLALVDANGKTLDAVRFEVRSP